jgi:hypothetical protein
MSSFALITLGGGEEIRSACDQRKAQIEAFPDQGKSGIKGRGEEEIFTHGDGDDRQWRLFILVSI